MEKLEAFLSALGRAGATIVILSNGLGDEIRAALQHVRLYHFFWRVLASEEQAVAAKSAPAAASKASMLSRLAFEARGDFTNIIFADDDRDNFPPLDYVATTIPPASDYDGPFDYDGLLLVGSTWKLVTVHDTTGTAVAAATIPCPATKLVAWPVGEGEGGNGLAGDDLDAILRWVGADAPHASPPTIPAAALALAEDPTRAWEIASLEQRVYTFPTIRFSHPKPKPEGVLRFVCVSDTHGREMNGALPEGDVLLHAGDFSMTGRPKEVASFVAWLKRQPHRRKIVIAGNHDLTLDLASYPQTHSRFGHPEQFDAAACIRMLAEAEGVDYLCDSSVTVDGITVYGSPWQPAFGDWAFNLPRGEPCRERWRQIPTGADVVMTHGPALGHGDLCSSGLRAGCIDLLHELQTRVRPRYHVAGHIHEGFGVTTDGTTTYMNASTCTQRYKADNPPLVFDVPLKSAHQID